MRNSACVWRETVSVLSFLMLAVGQLAMAGERLTPELLWKLGRVGEVAISPDGKQVAYLVTKYDLAENYGKSDLLLQTLQTLPPAAQLDQLPRSVGFTTPLQTAAPKTVLAGVKGLNSISWIQRPEGARLIYLAPTEGEKSTSQA